MFPSLGLHISIPRLAASFVIGLVFLFPCKKAFVTAIKHLSGNYAEKENMFHLITLFIPRLFVGMTSEENFGSEIGRASVFQFSEVRFRIEGTWIV